MNISTGDFHLRDFVRCKGCKKTSSWELAEIERWGNSQSFTDIFGVWVPGIKRYFCPDCLNAQTTTYWP